MHGTIGGEGLNGPCLGVGLGVRVPLSRYLLFRSSSVYTRAHETRD